MTGDTQDLRGQTRTTATAPAALAHEGTAATAAIDRAPQGPQRFNAATLTVRTGAATGSPTGIAVEARVEHRDPGGDWEPLASVKVEAEAEEATVNAPLHGAKAEVRAVVEADLTGGSGPTIHAVAVLVLGGAEERPAN